MVKELGISELVDERALVEELENGPGAIAFLGRLGHPYGQSVVRCRAGTGQRRNDGGHALVRFFGPCASSEWSPYLELSQEHGDLALMLDLEPRHTSESVCQRWQKLDQVGLKSSLHEHAAGFRVLANAVECPGGHLSVSAVRRIITLSRILSDVSVIALDSQLSEEALTAMRLSDHVLVVVRPDVPALRRAHRFCDQAIKSGVESGTTEGNRESLGAAGSVERKTKSKQGSTGLPSTSYRMIHRT